MEAVSHPYNARLPSVVHALYITQMPREVELVLQDIAFIVLTKGGQCLWMPVWCHLMHSQ